MLHWVAYRVGSFPLKERFDNLDLAISRARSLQGESFYAQVICAATSDAFHIRLLGYSIEFRGI
jgi:hypothetical protein